MTKTTSMNSNERTLNDRMVKLIGIPVLGVVIPNLSGIITNNLYSNPELIASYGFFILVALLVWQGNVILMYYIRTRFHWSFRSYYKIILAFFLANIVYSGALSALLLEGWKTFSREARNNNGLFINTIL